MRTEHRLGNQQVALPAIRVLHDGKDSSAFSRARLKIAVVCIVIVAHCGALLPSPTSADEPQDVRAVWLDRVQQLGGRTLYDQGRRIGFDLHDTE